MNYDFDTQIDRRNTSSLKWDKYGDDDIIPLWVADMDLAVAPEIMQALRLRLEHPVFGYTRASDALYDALLSHLRQIYNWEVQRDWIVWVPGVVSALSASVRAFAPAGSEIITNPPIYHHFFRVHDKKTHTLVQVPLARKGKRWTYDIDAMARACGPDTSLIMLCSPHNPTGTVFEPEEINAVCEIAKSCNAVVVSDEIHCGLVLSEQRPHVPTAMAAAKHTDSIVTLMSASKTFNLAGLNCSYTIIEDEALRERYKAASQEIIPGVGTLAYTATEAAFKSGEPWRQSLLAYLRGNYQFLQQSLEQIEGLELQALDATYLAWIDATALGLNDTAGYFEKHGLGFSAGEQFGQPHFLRLNFACSRATLEEAVARIKSAVGNLQ